MIEACFIFAGGAMGSLLRYLTGKLCNVYVKNFPLGTLVVNVVGSFLMGAISGALFKGSLSSYVWAPLVLDGFLGALTTFSSFAWETWNFFEQGKYGAGALNLLLNMLISLIAAYLGLKVGL